MSRERPPSPSRMHPERDSTSLVPRFLVNGKYQQINDLFPLATDNRSPITRA